MKKKEVDTDRTAQGVSRGDDEVDLDTLFRIGKAAYLI